MTVSSIGSNSRDYATPALWWVDVPDFTSDSWDGEMYNDSEFTSAVAPSLTGTDGNVTFSASLKPADGEGFADHTDKLTNALRYNQSNGVGMRTTAAYQQTIGIDSDYFELEGLQLSTGTVNALVIQSLGSNTIVRDCIFESASSIRIARLGGIGSTDCKAINCTFVGHTRGTRSRGIQVYYSAVEFDNCTFLYLSATTNGIDQTGTTGCIVKNCGIFGATNALEAGTWGAGTDYNATDDSTIPGGGSNNIVDLTTADQFENVASLGTLDLRAVSTGSLDENGVRDQANTNDLDIIGQDRSITTPTIGAWEVVSGEPILPINITDNMVGKDSVLVSVSTTVSDLGSGQDDFNNLNTDLSVQDSSQGVDSIPNLSVSLSIQDSSSAIDSISQIINSLLVQDSVSAIDSISQLLADISISDIGSGLDSIDVLTAVLKTVTDSGDGLDIIISPSVSLSVSDLSISNDNINQILASLSVEDSGSSTDTITALKIILKSVFDSGSGSDSVSMSVSLTVQDIATATDTISQIMNSLNVSDIGSGSDIVIKTEFIPSGKVTISFTIRVPGITTSIRQPGIDFNIN